jgi:anti-sigma factor RsiW
MDMISDDDLILFHYRDSLDASRLDEIERALATSATLRARYASIERTLATVDEQPAIEPDAGFEARLWRNLEPQLRRPRAAERASWLDRARDFFADIASPQKSHARLAFAGAFAVALALGIGFYAGRRSTPAAPAAATASLDAASARVLDVYVAEHLRATEGVLMTASNSDSSEILHGNRELAAQLVESNRLYAAAATRAGNTQLADFLRQIEPVLIALANPSPSPTVESSEGLRKYLDSTDLMFQVRAAEARLDRNGTHRT